MNELTMSSFLPSSLSHLEISSSQYVDDTTLQVGQFYHNLFAAILLFNNICCRTRDPLAKCSRPQFMKPGSRSVVVGKLAREPHAARRHILWGSSSCIAISKIDSEFSPNV